MRVSFSSAVLVLASAAAASPSVVIVPGAWQVDPSWDGFMQKLESSGYDTSKVTLPSVGISLTGLEEDVAAATGVIDPLLDAGKDVVLLSHSLGGLIAGNAVQGRDVASREKAGKKGGIVQLIYLAAFMTPAGASLKDLMGGSYFPWMEVAVGFQPLRYRMRVGGQEAAKANGGVSAGWQGHGRPRADSRDWLQRHPVALRGRALGLVHDLDVGEGLH